jgi:hypothetical protein
MKNINRMSIALSVAGMLATWGAGADVPRPIDPWTKTTVPRKHSPRSEQPEAPRRAEPVLPETEASPEPSAPTGSGTANPFSPSQSPNLNPNTPIAAPVTIAYGGASTALAVTDSGTGKGISSSLTNAKNLDSALYGTTSGGGTGVTGINTGTKGLAASFQLTNAANAHSAVSASTPGGGSAITGTITNAHSDAAAVYGYNLVSPAVGVGVEGDGNYQGVYGYSPDHFGVYGYSPAGVGMLGSSPNYHGVEAYSTYDDALYASTDLGYAVYADSSSGSGVYAGTFAGNEALYANNESGGHGITAYSSNGIGIYASSGTSFGIWGQSTNTFGVIGEDAGSGVGVYGYSARGYAGRFDGPVIATSYSTSSDRNAKTDFRPVDAEDILARVSRLSITSWNFKTDLTKRHVGPMAQDFHAEFGLDGADDTHINLTDLGGISLAAIQALHEQMQAKDAQLNAQAAEIARISSEFREQQEEIAGLKQANAAMQAALEKLVVKDSRVVMAN